MKQFVQFYANKALFLFFLIGLQLSALAQDSSSSSSTTTSKTDIKIESGQNDAGNWYANPWIWVVAAALFILLLVALLRGNSGRRTTGASDSVTVSKTVRRDSDLDA